MNDLRLVDVESCREVIKQALPCWNWNDPEHDPLYNHPFEQIVRPALKIQFEIIARKDAEIERLKVENAELSGEVQWLKECESREVERLKALFKNILAQCVGEAEADYIMREHFEEEDEK